jgi:hypothetical protein
MYDEARTNQYKSKLFGYYKKGYDLWKGTHFLVLCHSIRKENDGVVCYKIHAFLSIKLYFYSLLTYSVTPWYRIFFEKLIVTQLVKQQPSFYMEPKGSLQYLQNPATGPYPEPAESSLPH